MRALLLSEYKKLSVVDVPIPAVADDEALVRVKACGVCGSDIHGYDGSTGRRIPPLVMGHEAAGIVERVGSGVKGFTAGDRVTFDSMVSCGACGFCREGHINLCDNRMVIGVSCSDYRRHGAFAEYVSVPARILYKLPETLSFERAALTEAVSIAVHAVNRHVPGPRDTAVVIGAGMIGVLTIQVLKARGVQAIVAVDLDAQKLELAQRMGATQGIRAGQADVPEAIAALTGGRGADVAFEVVGHGDTVATAIRSVRKGGTVVIIGNLSPAVELPLQSVVTREISVLGSCGSMGEIPECVDLLARGVIDVDPIISLTAPLDDGPALFARLYDGDQHLMKVILRP